MRKLSVLSVTLGCAFALPAAAGAASSLGTHPDGVLAGSSTTCPQACTLQQDVLSNEQLRVPARGVVVAWRVRGRDGQARLRQLGANGAGQGATGWIDLSGAPQEIPAALPVQAGDGLAVELSAGAAVDSQPSFAGGDRVARWSPALADGAARAPDGTLDVYMAVQAIVEPDADGDGLGDETQDSCVNCGGGTPPPPPPGGGDGPLPPAPDPYAAIRASGPQATIAGSATRTGRKVAVTVTNPYGFPISGKLQLKRGRKVVAKAAVKLAASATRTVMLRVRKPARTLTAVATLRAPVGPALATKRRVKVSKPKPGKGGIDGKYRGDGAAADWVLVIENGVVTNFNGSISTYCTKASKQRNHTFAMIADDPDPRVAAGGTFAWEATTGYGYDKLKFDGRVRNGTVSGKMMVESRPPISGADPVTGMPRIEFEYCFAGRDYTLVKR